MSDLQPTLATLVDDLLSVQEAMEPLKQREADLKARIREAAQPGENEAGAHTVTLSPNRRLDLAAVARDFPVEANQHLYKLVPDTKKVNDHLAKAVLSEYMKESGDARMTIR